MSDNWSTSPSSSAMAIPYLNQAIQQCGDPGHPLSIFPKTGYHGSGTEYDPVLPIGILYHCLKVSTATMCIGAHEPSPSSAVADGSIGGLSTDNMLQNANQNPGIISQTRWGTVEPWVHTAGYVVQVVHPTLLALGFVSNLLVFSILCCRRMRSGVNSFLLSSTLAQIFYIIAIFLLHMVDYSKSYINHVFHTEGRTYIHHFSYFFYLIILWQIIAAGIERVVTGFTPDSAKRRCSPWRADVVNVFIWMAAFGLVFPVLWFSKLQFVLGYTTGTSTGTNPYPMAGNVLYWLELIFSIFIPYPSLLILVFLLVSSLLKQISSMHKITLGSNGELWRQKVEEDTQLTRLVLVQVILFFLLTGAYAIGQLVLTLNLVPDQTVCMWSILIDLFQLGPLLYSSLQFILFGCIVEKFAVTFRNVCCRCCGKYE